MLTVIAIMAEHVSVERQKAPLVNVQQNMKETGVRNVSSRYPTLL